MLTYTNQLWQYWIFPRWLQTLFLCLNTDTKPTDDEVDPVVGDPNNDTKATDDEVDPVVGDSNDTSESSTNWHVLEVIIPVVIA